MSSRKPKPWHLPGARTLGLVDLSSHSSGSGVARGKARASAGDLEAAEMALEERAVKGAREELDAEATFTSTTTGTRRTMDGYRIPRISLEVLKLMAVGTLLTVTATIKRPAHTEYVRDMECM